MRSRDEWDKNAEALKEYHEVRRAYYEKRAQRFLARARRLRRKGVP